MTIAEKFAQLRAKYPEALPQIQAEQVAFDALLEDKDLASHPAMARVISTCRETIRTARMQLATDKALIDNPEKQRDLWALIEARLWFVRLFARDFDAEMRAIDAQLAQDLGE